jgi:DNA polymerase III alpha subunit
LKTVLDDRILFFDGTCQVASDKIVDLLIHGVPISKIAAFECDEDIQEYNKLADEPMKSGEIQVHFVPDFSWQIPGEFINLDISAHLYDTLTNKFASHIDFSKYRERLEIEINEIRARNLFDMMKALIFIIDYFKKHNVVYGVGRGSSCASLALFLIGVHCIDPIKYEISHLEFFHE